MFLYSLYFTESMCENVEFMIAPTTGAAIAEAG
jgi:hypothetical protein